MSEHFQIPIEFFFIEKDQIITINTQIYEGCLSWLGTGTSIKIAGLN
jgi:hypothetical protein